ncbi:carbon storage regulator CsrA [Clostridiisalibacter paucivorans]|uniref:carbon storage regulator CsrA n=1 Tax=Clostridiisalibacter paucivorans TaxID=408753 RepID=UPI00047E5C1E|nr:carbon storage regulator CsrA [Clostridiisalibacter paucivorans]
MLVLTRKKDESIIIGENIEIVITEIEEGKVKLGINAPRDINIYRKEIYEDIRTENKEAANNRDLDMDVIRRIFNR